MPEKPTLKKAAEALLKYIQEEGVYDEWSNDGDGYTDQWQSNEFRTLINNMEEALKTQYEYSRLIDTIFDQRR